MTTSSSLLRRRLVWMFKHFIVKNRCHLTRARSQGCQSLTLLQWSLLPLAEFLAKPPTPPEHRLNLRYMLSLSFSNIDIDPIFHNSSLLGPWPFRRCGPHWTKVLMSRPLLGSPTCLQKTSRKDFMAFRCSCNNTFHVILRGFFIYVFLLPPGLRQKWQQLVVQVNKTSHLDWLSWG